ncbi:MAG: hypothetical protein JO270_18385 [Acidobacteriaceae bacterium]|nr:hypothetical protein [Acidobacteriaceae bacterium]
MAEDLQGELYEAIQAGDFPRMCILMPQYRERLEKQLAATENAEDRRQMLQGSLVFLEESLHLARVIRAHMAARLRAMNSLCCYQSSEGGTSRWSVNG